MITAEDVLDLPVSARVATQARLPLPVGSTTSVSVVIPAKNVAAYVGETLASALAQGEVTEVIVVDDGSTDNTIAIVRAIRDPRLRLMTNDSAGVSAARNLGARHASGEWLLFLDADDRLRPGAVAALLAAARGAPRAVLVYGDYNTIDSEGRQVGRRDLLKGRRKPSGDVLTRLAASNFIVNGGIALARAEAFRAIGGFDTSLRYCEDWHCWCRLAAIGEFEFAPKLLLDYRLHTANTMNAAVRTPQDFFPAIARVFDDGLILARLPEGTAARLRQAAEIHLVTYSAMQAVRFGRYRQAFTYLGMVGRRSLKSLPRSALRVALACFGI
ncbi:MULTISPECIES: glycosyltransferase [Bradyrhizobium]|uniref:UDP-hexose transferase n=1 Tax=Bradyrhizobium diazoefficiens TaxID=1355477 RepID=A0A809ZMY4_9BRAD|nr:glycosyltransferase [Bradyrhizobium diazoefficiens]MBP1062032.1 glycosyltransferase involved in cell wall biosynthesis [Bradyrhizobium japonicum]AND92511.1 UDP-hexose transferase [Bradyrhizobium diazoefficiens USDA 110]AWO95417.2 glycosyltransferase [Bradyrhizobium diazoefficiens]QLD40839.1 glycosyltransferase [Bradyrhizobium diazoefficiens]WLA75246.1 glycosyltransferase [Bradyrhizobium diazoefficiens]